MLYMVSNMVCVCVWTVSHIISCMFHVHLFPALLPLSLAEVAMRNKEAVVFICLLPTGSLLLLRTATSAGKEK